MIVLTFFRDDINLVSSVIVRILNYAAHCLRAVAACVYRDPFSVFPTARDCGTAASACCVSEDNQAPAELVLETVFSGRGFRAAVERGARCLGKL